MNTMKTVRTTCLRLATIQATLVLILVATSTAAADPADPASLFSGLHVSEGTGTTGSASDEVVDEVGPYTIVGPGEVKFHRYFERTLDAPPFYNFTSIETNIPTGYKRVNHGTCYGISMFTVRYYQWFILPHLLDNGERYGLRAKYSRRDRSKVKRPLPNYALQIAKDFKLPEWVLRWPSGSASQSRRAIAPYRLRTYLEADKELQRKVHAALTGDEHEELNERFATDFAKEHSIRMFDNQMGLMRKGAQLYEWVSRRVQSWGDAHDSLYKRLFGKCSYDMAVEYMENPRLGCFEVAMWGSTLKGNWGHSVVGYKITEYNARKANDDEEYKAYRVEIYDNNDPENYNDCAYYYFPEEQRWAPSKKYASLYDGESPLVPAGEYFMRTTQMGPSTDSMFIKFEENLMNRFSRKFEAVELEGNRGR